MISRESKAGWATSLIPLFPGVIEESDSCIIVSKAGGFLAGVTDLIAMWRKYRASSDQNSINFEAVKQSVAPPPPISFECRRVHR